jgi:hypothetical protein
VNTAELQNSLKGIESDLEGSLGDELAGILEELESLQDVLQSSAIGSLIARLREVRAIAVDTLPTALRDVTAALQTLDAGESDES